MVRWDRGSLVVKLYASIIPGVAPAKMRRGTLVLTMRKIDTAKTWPSFERDGLGPCQYNPPTQRARGRASSADAVRTRQIRVSLSPRSASSCETGAELSALGIADAVARLRQRVHPAG